MASNPSAFTAAAGDINDEGVVTVLLRGEFDLAAVEMFTDAVESVAALSPAVVELNLEGVTFIDSSGVGAIVVAARSITERGATIRLGARSAVVDRVLEVSGLEVALESQGAD